MNLNCYGYGPEDDRQWIIVDVGVTFGDLSTPGVDIIVPDPAFLEGENIRGIVLTHAHEDHIGALRLAVDPHEGAAVRHALHRLPDPREAARRRRPGQVKIIEVPLGGTSISARSRSTMITMTHSIAEPNGLAIKTPLGTVFHTGDWKLDPTTRSSGEPTDVAAITAPGRRGPAGHGLRLAPTSSSRARRGRRPRPRKA